MYGRKRTPAPQVPTTSARIIHDDGTPRDDADDADDVSMDAGNQSLTTHLLSRQHRADTQYLGGRLFDALSSRRGSSDTEYSRDTADDIEAARRGCSTTLGAGGVVPHSIPSELSVGQELQSTAPTPVVMVGSPQPASVQLSPLHLMSKQAVWAAAPRDKSAATRRASNQRAGGRGARGAGRGRYRPQRMQLFDSYCLPPITPTSRPEPLDIPASVPGNGVAMTSRSVSESAKPNNLHHILSSQYVPTTSITNAATMAVNSSESDVLQTPGAMVTASTPLLIHGHQRPRTTSSTTVTADASAVTTIPATVHWQDEVQPTASVALPVAAPLPEPVAAAKPSAKPNNSAWALAPSMRLVNRPRRWSASDLRALSSPLLAPPYLNSADSAVGHNTASVRLHNATTDTAVDEVAALPSQTTGLRVNRVASTSDNPSHQWQRHASSIGRGTRQRRTGAPGVPSRAVSMTDGIRVEPVRASGSPGPSQDVHAAVAQALLDERERQEQMARDVRIANMF